MPNSKSILWLMLAVAIYSVAQLTWYLPTPLGQNPVLDGQENLILAQQIQEGTLPAEPFYRAMLYPAILALLPIGPALFGLLCHLANTWLILKISSRIWKSHTAGMVSAALVGFNPVLLHFAFDPLDITFSITLFLGAIHCFQSAFRRFLSDSARQLRLAQSGFLLALAALARPHFMAVLLPLCLLLLIAPYFKRLRLKMSLAFVAAALVPLLSYGWVQKSHSGSFRILPWQGAYNLWISNKPEANGLYFTQSIEVQYTGEHQNPTRLEAETLYQQETGQTGTIDEQNAYWKGKAVKSILHHPFRWMGLMTFKTYALLNNFEQYNNKTYSFHKHLSPWLRYNPLGWGIIAILATFTIATLWRQKRFELHAFTFLTLSYAAGVLLYMASARFRLPLAPLLAIAAGGFPIAYSACKASSLVTRRRSVIAAVSAAAICFSPFFGIASKETYLQDTLLLADASARSGDDHAAVTWATVALQLDPTRQTAKRIRALSQYNLATSGKVQPDRYFWQEMAEELATIDQADPQIDFLRGLVFWNIGSANQAYSCWQDSYTHYGTEATSSLAAMILIEPRNQPADLPDEIFMEIGSGQHGLLAYSLIQAQPNDKRDGLRDIFQMSPERFTAIDQSIKRVLPLR